MPTDLPLHPAFVHIPLGIAMAMPFVAIALALAVWKGRLPRAALAVVAGLQLMLAGSGFVAMQLGDHDAKKAASIAPRNAIEDHDDAASTFVFVAAGVAALSVAALFVPLRRAPLVAALVAVGTVAVAALGVDAGRKGGELVFRYGAGRLPDAADTPSSGAVVGPATEKDE